MHERHEHTKLTSEEPWFTVPELWEIVYCDPPGAEVVVVPPI